MHPRSSPWFSFRVFASRGASPRSFTPFKPSLKCDVANYAIVTSARKELKEREKHWIVQFSFYFLLSCSMFHVRAPMFVWSCKYSLRVDSWVHSFSTFLVSTCNPSFFCHLIVAKLSVFTRYVSINCLFLEWIYPSTFLKLYTWIINSFLCNSHNLSSYN